MRPDHTLRRGRRAAAVKRRGRLATAPCGTAERSAWRQASPLPLAGVRRLALVLAVLLLSPGAAPGGPVRAEIEPGLVALLTEGHQIFVEALPEKGEGLLAFSRRLTGGEEAVGEIAAANGDLAALKAGIRYRVPYEQLTGPLKVKALTALFRDDRPAADGWHHRARGVGALERESLWHVAQWFTGRGEHFSAIRAHNRLSDEELAAGSAVVIPPQLLLPSLREVLPPPEPAAEPATTAAGETATAATAAAAGSSVNGYQLRYGSDRAGDYAGYRLRAGEALYSSVVVRFTGLLAASDVNALAKEIAQRSGIADLTDIPIGYEVKIPLDLLLPEYLPAGHPRRQEYEAALAASRRFGNQVRSLDLAGVTVILDPGHGGRDSGTTFGGVWESLYVYDVTLRVKHLLETYTAARVVLTVHDGDRLVPEDRDVLSYSRGHRVMTNPPYPIEVAPVGVNLRWYLANSVFSELTKAGADSHKVVFISLHADSLHPSLRGATVYIPDARLRAGTFGRKGAVYNARAEYREQPRVSFSWKNRVESEGLSRDLANHLVDAFRRRELAVHPYKPVREKIIRRRSQYVPAVLRYNAVPAKVLLELCNLANSEDRKLLLTRTHRQKLAETVVEGLLAYYGLKPGPVDVQVAAGR